MKVLLLGGTGYFGGEIAEYLSKKQCDVVCAIRHGADTKRLEAMNKVKLILVENGQIEHTMEEEGIDWVINSTCCYESNHTLYGDMIEANLVFPLNILNMAAKYKVKNFVTVGTGLPADFNFYSFTKNQFSIFGKFLCMKEKINFVDLRMEMFYGGKYEPIDRFLRNCAEKLIAGEELQLSSGEQKRDILRIEDAVGLIFTLICGSYDYGYHKFEAGSGEKHSIREIVTFMKEVVGSTSELKFGAVAERGGEPDTLADISWYEEVGYKMRYGYFDGLRKECMESLERTENLLGGGINVFEYLFISSFVLVAFKTVTARRSASC